MVQKYYWRIFLFKIYILLILNCFLKVIYRLNDLSELSEPGVCTQRRQTIRQPNDQPQMVQQRKLFLNGYDWCSGKNWTQQDVKIGVEEKNDRKLLVLQKKSCCHLKSSCSKKCSFQINMFAHWIFFFKVKKFFFSLCNY